MLDLLYIIIIYPLIQIFEVIFVFAQKLFKETGFSIICVSGAISILCLPLYMVAERWQEVERDIQKLLAPKIKKIKAVFKGDEQYMILSALYKQNNYHPIYAMRGTFGLLFQVPFFIAAYTYLSHFEILNGSSFLFIKDLGSPDSFITTTAGSINILPLLMTFINCSSAFIYSNKFEFKDKIQLYIISLIFLILLYNSPSGLVLYWTLNNIFSLFKNIYIKLNIKYKKQLLYSIISIICTIFIFYTMFILRRGLIMKTIISSLFLFIGIIPWLFPLIKNIIRKINCINYSNKNCFLIYILSLIAICIICGTLIPSQLIGSSVQEFSNIDSYGNPLYFIGYTSLQTFGFFVFWPICLYFLFSNKVKKIFTLLFLIFFFISLCNLFIFDKNYGLISLELVFDKGVHHNFKDILFNILVLLLVSIIILFFFTKIGVKLVLPLISIPVITLFTISILNITEINKEYKASQEFLVKNQPIKAIEPIFNLSKTGKNTIVIMLDRATSGFFPYILEEDPNLYDIYNGFVYYPNTVSFNGYTRLGAPPLFGGYEYTPFGFNNRNDVPMREKHNEALLMLPIIFSNNNYDVTITDPPYPNYSLRDDLRIYDKYPQIKAHITYGKYIDIWLKENNMNLPTISDVLKRNIFWYSFFKIMPYAFREGIYQFGGWFAPFSGYKFISNLNAYSVLDFLNRLTSFSCNNDNSFIFLVNETSHSALHYQAPDFRPSFYISNYGTSPYSKENEYHTNIGAIKRLGEWFEFFKKENVYNNTRIIIVSDHGAQLNYVLKTDLPFNLDNFNPLLLVKDFNSDGALKTDMSFMSNADVPFLAVLNQIENAVNPWTGKQISDIEKNNPLYIAISGGIHLENPDSTMVHLNKEKDYFIKDNIFEFRNWIKASEK